MKTLLRLLVLALLLGSGLPTASAQPNSRKPMSTKKILFVVTSHDRKGDTGQPTGYYLSEVAHPWAVLRRAGYEIDFVSPRGGKAPVDGFDLTDPVNKAFWDDATYRRKVEHTLTPAAVNPADYAAIYFAGGHGAMWDLADNAALAALTARIYEQQGVVGAVCHGPAGLVNVRLSTGRYLVDGKRLSAFTNEEEAAVGLSQTVPFLLESRLLERGARHEKVALWQPYVVVDQRLVTGQNPASATGVGEALVAELAKLQPAAAQR